MDAFKLFTSTIHGGALGTNCGGRLNDEFRLSVP